MYIFKIYVGSHFENGPLSIMDDPASILGRAVPVLMTGPVKFVHFQYGDRDLVMFVDGSGMFFFWQHNTRHPTHTLTTKARAVLK